MDTRPGEVIPTAALGCIAVFWSMFGSPFCCCAERHWRVRECEGSAASLQAAVWDSLCLRSHAMSCSTCFAFSVNAAIEYGSRYRVLLLAASSPHVIGHIHPNSPRCEANALLFGHVHARVVSFHQSRVHPLGGEVLHILLGFFKPSFA